MLFIFETMAKKIIIAGGGIISNEQDEILMIFRRGVWDLPKGKLDDGETIEACALREVEEETGVQNVQLGPLVGVTYHEYFDTWKQRDVSKETHWFAMRISGAQNLVPQAEEDIEEIKWVSKNEMVTYLQKSHKNIVVIMDKYYNM